jgi:hypothetical protein
MAVQIDKAWFNPKDGTISCCGCAQLACQVDSYLYGNLVGARNQSALSKWFREGDWYRSGGVGIIRGSDDEVMCRIEPRYAGLRFFLRPSDPKDAGLLVEWDQMFRHCRHNVVDPDEMFGLDVL